MRLIVNLFKFLLGFLLALVLLGLGGYAAAQYLMLKFNASLPERPIFSEEQPKESSKPAKATAASAPAASPSPEAASPSPSPKPLEPGAYTARVTWSEGLVLRGAPGIDGEPIGGVDYNEQVVVIEDSADKQWQRIRIEGSDREGWVKAGNLSRAN